MKGCQIAPKGQECGYQSYLDNFIPEAKRDASGLPAALCGIVFPDGKKG